MQTGFSSSVSIGKRISEPRFPNHYLSVENIPADEVCVVYFGGSGAEYDRIANGYAKIIQKEILNKVDAKIPVYAVTYNFGSNEEGVYVSDPVLSRRIAYIQKGMYQDKKHAQDVLDIAEEEDYNPTYVRQLAEKIILPRISCNGKKISVKQAAQKIRKLTIVAHCHGGYVALKMEEKMQEMMKKMGYKESERNFIQSQLLILAHSPECPLGVSKSQFISFLSIADEQLKQADNWFKRYIRRRQEEEKKRIRAEEYNDEENIKKYRMFPFEASFFPGNLGNFFLVKQKFRRVFNMSTKEDEKFFSAKEHADLHYTDDGSKTEEGRLLTSFARNILINGIQNSLAQNDHFVPLPAVEQLILSRDSSQQKKDKIQFEKMKENGKFFADELKREKIIYARLQKLKKALEKVPALMKDKTRS